MYFFANDDSIFTVNTLMIKEMYSIRFSWSL